MTTRGLCAECARRRDGWFTHLAAAIVGRESADDLLPEALSRMTAGVGHMHGLRDDELTFTTFPLDAVRAEIRRWRTGRVEPRTARLGHITWVSLRQYGQSSGRLSNDVLDEIANSPATRIPSLERAPTLPHPGCDHDRDLYDRTPFGVLSFPNNHLATVRLLLDADGDTALKTFTPLEILSSLDDDPSDVTADSVLVDSRRVIDVPLAVPGGWSGSCPDGLTGFQREWILNRGARNQHQTTGVVPGWFMTAETYEDLNVLKRLRYACGFSLDVRPDSLNIHLHPLAADGEPSGLRIEYRYGVDATGLSRLAILATMRLILVDLLFLDHRNQLQHITTFQMEMPDEVAETIAAFVKHHAPDSGELDFFAEAITEGEEAELRASSAEMRRHEIARIVRATIEGRATTEVDTATRRYLDALERYTALDGQYLGNEPSSIAELEEARLALRSSLAGTGLHLPAINQGTLTVLGPGRAFVHLECDTDGRLQPVASWLDESGTPQFKAYSCGVWNPTRNHHAGSARIQDTSHETGQIEALTAALRPLQHLLDLDLPRIVICPSELFTQTPAHQALLALGFKEASYAPSLALLQPINPASPPPPKTHHINGWPGTGTGRLSGVDAELALLSAFYDTPTDRTTPDSGTYPLIHIAGHASVGPNEAGTGIHLKTSTLTGAHVLRELNLAGTKLVVLAACGTGHSAYGPTELLEQTPLDACFITVGAAACISTTRPVSDRVAAVFSASLHHALTHGDLLWDAYERARTDARTLDRRHLPDITTTTLDRLSPGWDLEPLTPTEVNDWMTFKLNGTHWQVSTPL